MLPETLRAHGGAPHHIPNEQQDDCDAKNADPDFRAYSWLHEPATVENTPAYTGKDTVVASSKGREKLTLEKLPKVAKSIFTRENKTRCRP